MRRRDSVPSSEFLIADIYGCRSYRVDVLLGEFRTDSAHQVLAVSDRLKVGRVDASSLPTEMINVVALGYRAYFLLIHGAVGIQESPSQIDVCVPLIVQMPSPDPARCTKTAIFYAVVRLVDRWTLLRAVGVASPKS